MVESDTIYPRIRPAGRLTEPPALIRAAIRHIPGGASLYTNELGDNVC